MKMICLILTAVLAAGLGAAGFEKEIAEIKEGKRTEAKASWWGFDQENATACLQAAINSGVKKLIIDNTGSDWILDPVELIDNQEIVLAENVVLTARKGGYKGVRDTMLGAYSRQNITIRGESGATIRMHKKDYQNKAEYKHSEWRHSLAFWACDNITVRDLTIQSSGGDGIYIGGAWFPLKGEVTTRQTVQDKNALGTCSNILIENVICDDHHRQGISVISARNLLIRKCVLKNTQGTAPAAGIDFEPNRPNEVLENCIMEDCIVENNAGGGILVATEINTPVDLKIRRCTIIGGTRGLSCTPPTDRGRTNPGAVEVSDCKFIDNVNSGIVIGNHLSKFYKIDFKNCEMINSGTALGITPISFTYNRPTQGEVGNVHFDNVSIKAISGRKIIAFKNWTPNTYLGQVTGILNVDGRKIDAAEYIKQQGYDKGTDYRSREVDLSKLSPAAPEAKPTKYAFFLRQHFNLVLWGKAGEEIKFELKGRDMKQKLRELTFKLVDADGKTTELGKMAPDETKTFSFTPEKTGAYLIDANITMHMVQFKPLTSFHWAMKGTKTSDGYVNVFKPSKRGVSIYFAVPENLTEFRVEVTGYPGESVTAEIKSPDGKLIERREHFDGPEIFTVKRDSTKAEIWSITLRDAIEDVQLRILEPLSPLFSENPANLLIEK